MKYRIIKQEPNGTIYDVERNGESELILHLQSTFENTDHKVIAVINLTSSSS